MLYYRFKKIQVIVFNVHFFKGSAHGDSGGPVWRINANKEPEIIGVIHGSSRFDEEKQPGVWEKPYDVESITVAEKLTKKIYKWITKMDREIQTINLRAKQHV